MGALEKADIFRIFNRLKICIVSNKFSKLESSSAIQEIVIGLKLAWRRA